MVAVKTYIITRKPITFFVWVGWTREIAESTIGRSILLHSFIPLHFLAVAHWHCRHLENPKLFQKKLDNLWF